MDPDSKKQTVRKKNRQITNDLYKTIRNLNTGQITDNINKLLFWC